VSALALVVVAVFMIAAPKKTPDKAPSGGGDGPGGTVTAPTGPNWGQPMNPDGDCTITPQGETLTISVPATLHALPDVMGKNNAPRVLQEVDGDFSVQVKVCGTIHPQGGPSLQAAGLLLWSDEGNYVRLVRSGQNRK